MDRPEERLDAASSPMKAKGVGRVRHLRRGGRGGELRLQRHGCPRHGKRRRVPLAAGRAKVWRGSARKSGRTDCYRPACRGFWVDHPTSEAVQLAAPADMMTCW